MSIFEPINDRTGKKSLPHACIIFDDMAAYRRVAIEFILEGLNHNEKCIMATDRFTPAMIAADFEAAGEPLDRYLESGRLSILNVMDAYSGSDGFEPDQAVEIWQNAATESVEQGFSALRVVGEATFSLGSPELADKLIYYENIMNEKLFPHYPFKSLCVYDKSRYPASIIKAAIKAHSVLIYNEELYHENIHYIPPEIYFKKDGQADEVDFWLKNVRRNNENVRALRESENKFRRLFDQAPVSYQSLDEKGDILEVNDTWLSVLGYNRNEVIGRNFSAFLHPDWQSHFKENFPRFKAVGEVLGVEFEMMKKDGTTMLVSFQGKIGKTTDNFFQQTHCIFEDITQRKKTQETLKFQAMLLDQIQDLVTATDLDGNINYVNDAVCRSLGRGRKALLGQPISLFGEDSGQGATQQEIVTKTLQDGRWRGEVVNYTRDGAEIIMDCRTHLVRDEFQNPVSLVGVSTDITRQKENSKRLIQAQKMEAVGNLAGGIAHDFNNLLYPMIGYAEMLAEDLADNQTYAEQAEEIVKAGRRASELVQQILSFSRVSDETNGPVRVQQVLKEVLKLCRATIPRNIDLVHSIDSTSGVIRGDAGQLHQVAMNLITNAFHAVEETGGTISVALTSVSLNRDTMGAMNLSPGPYVRLSITDDGVGMETPVLEKIFEPYYTTKKNGKGTGLGLSMVYGIVKGFKGDIQVKTQRGTGTTFHLYFPEMVTGDTRKGPLLKKHLPGGTETILLVDDETAILNIEKSVLERRGYKVEPFSSSPAALEAFVADPRAFDLVVTDMTMPHMTGDVLAAKVLEINPVIPVIICTGYSRQIGKVKVDGGSVRKVLMKPISSAVFAHAVRDALDKGQTPAGAYS